MGKGRNQQRPVEGTRPGRKPERRGGNLLEDAGGRSWAPEKKEYGQGPCGRLWAPLELERARNVNQGCGLGRAEIREEAGYVGELVRDRPLVARRRGWRGVPKSGARKERGKTQKQKAGESVH